MKRLAAIALLALALPAAAEPPAHYAAPQRVVIEGYDGDTMEPFLSRDGQQLFFNNRNGKSDQTDIYWATRIDDLHYRFKGKLPGVNSFALDGVSTMSAAGRFCFVSPRAYAQTLATIHCGDWTGSGVKNVKLQAQATPHVPGRVVFDVEIDPAGKYLLIADGDFKGRATVQSSALRMARLVDGEFRLSPDDDKLLAAVNTPGGQQYAAGLSADGLTLSFTRLEGLRPFFAHTSIWLSRRASQADAFGPPVKVDAINGQVEAATFAADGSLIYHKRDNGRFTLWRVQRLP